MNVGQIGYPLMLRSLEEGWNGAQRKVGEWGDW